jgi:DNA-binding transcriptional LysR family regulator
MPNSRQVCRSGRRIYRRSSGRCPKLAEGQAEEKKHAADRVCGNLARADALCLDRAGRDVLGHLGRGSLDRLAAVSLRVQVDTPARGVLHVSALPTFAMRWLIPRLPEFQRDHPGLELRIVTASTPVEQFRMDVDAVISGPSRQPVGLECDSSAKPACRC